MGILFSLSKRNITPGFPTCLACSQQKDTLFKKINDEIFVRCAALDNDGNIVLILAYDLLFHSRDLYDFVCGYIKSNYDIASSNILINYTHNHNSPSTLGYNDFSSSSEYESFLLKKTQECIDDVLNNFEPGFMEYGILSGNWNINRRKMTDKGIQLLPNPDGPADTNLYVLKLTSVSGETRGLLVNYACHPVHYPDTLAITSEYPGFLCKYLEEELPACTSLFIQGAGADARPLGTADGNQFIKRPYEYIEKMAASMRDVIFTGINSGNFSIIKPSFSSVSMNLEIPIEDMGREYFKTNMSNKNLSAHLRRNAEWIYKNFINMKNSFTLACGLIKLSENLIIAHMGGEPCCEVKFNIERQLIGYNTMFAGYTDACAYIVTDKMLSEGGYEVRCFLEYMHKGRIKPGINRLINEGFAAALLKL